MAMMDLLSDLTLTRGALQTLSGTTPNNSALIDMRGYQALSVYMLTGTVTDAGDTGGFTMNLQHSDSTATGTFVDCTASEASGTLTVTVDTNDDILGGGNGVRYIGNKRYVRAVFTGTSGTNAIVSVLFVQGKNSSVSAPVTAIGATTAAT